MSEGWPLFLENLRLHLAHFCGQRPRCIPTAIVPGTRHSAFELVSGALGVPADLGPGDRLEASARAASPLAGEVASVVTTGGTRAYHLVLDRHAPATAFLSAEQAGETVGLSLWLYLYGDAAADLPDAWTPFLAALGARPAPTR